ncbi:MAG: ferredoxin family protein [Anaerolineales bacterium]|jgi:NAD-dependent dihydropyrimidine dehydrogenase PreA subunit
MSEQPTLWSSLAEHWHLARTLRKLRIQLDPDKCTGIWECYEVCPVACWKPDFAASKVILERPEDCIACGACVLQCPEDAITLS